MLAMMYDNAQTLGAGGESTYPLVSIVSLVWCPDAHLLGRTERGDNH